MMDPALEQQLAGCFARSDPWAEALAAVIAHFGADSGTVHLMGGDGMLHLRTASAGIPPPVIEIIRVVPVGKGMAGLAAERKQSVTACNIQTDSSGDVRPGARATGLEGAIALPMLEGDRVAGVLGIANRRERVFSADEESLLLETGRWLAARTASR
ncbi:MAG: GAF domain-containing protein [Acidobacteria bacterium]|nr:GAF domain-containing protein [Acidobacteriota bacterium]